MSDDEKGSRTPTPVPPENLRRKSSGVLAADAGVDGPVKTKPGPVGRNSPRGSSSAKNVGFKPETELVGYSSGETRSAYPWAADAKSLLAGADDDDEQEEEDPVARWLAFKRLNTVRETMRELQNESEDDEELKTPEEKNVVGAGSPSGITPSASVGSPTHQRKASDVKVVVDPNSAPLMSPPKQSKMADKLRRQTEYPQLEAIVTNSYFTTLMSLCTVWALFGSDLILLVASKSADDPNAAVMLVIFLLFLAELIAFSLVRGRDYFLSFWFWMDLLAVLSLIPDWIVLFGGGTETLTSLTVARAARAARAASRTARLTRLVKGFQLLVGTRRKKGDDQRYSWFESTKENDPTTASEQEMHNLSDMTRINEMEDDLTEKSVVGEYTTKLMFQKLFSVVLLMFVFFSLVEPLLVTDLEEHHAEVSLGELTVARDNFSGGDFTTLVNYYTQNNDKLLLLEINGVTLFQSSKLDDLRSGEKVKITVPGAVARFDYSFQSKAIALAAILSTLFVIVLMTVFSTLMNNDVNEVFVKPIEKMVAIVKLLAVNPLATLRVTEDFEYETGLLQTMVTKLAVLLQLGFGAAGSSIISSNLSSSGPLVPLQSGRQVLAIYGSIRVHGFIGISEGLGQDVVLFVNKLASLIHNTVAEFGGFPTHNSYNGHFTVVWILPKHNDAQDEEYRKSVAYVADAAVKAFARLKRICLRNKELKRMLAGRCDVERVNATFGLHLGWSVRGAIGSALKVDAQYISNNVLLAHNLQERALTHGTNFLLSQEVYSYLSPRMKRTCMKIDNIRFRSAHEPVVVYTDVDPEGDGSGWKEADSKWVEAHSQGVNEYIDGNWGKALKTLRECLKTKGDYEGTKRLVAFMESQNSQAPSSWKGYRDVTEEQAIF